jgi:hypothetical protein
MKRELYIAVAVPLIGFGLPILGFYVGAPAFSVFVSLGLSILWTCLAIQIIDEYGKRGLWIFLAAPFAYFWWLPMIFPII